MGCIKFSVILFSLVALISCKPNGGTQKMSDARLPTEAAYVLPKREELPLLKKEAMSGSGLAARQLSLWYMKLPEDRDTYEYWTSIGAENGDSVAQYNMAISYREGELIHDVELSQLRYFYWLKKSALQGNARAKAELESIPRQ